MAETSAFKQRAIQNVFTRFCSAKYAYHCNFFPFPVQTRLAPWFCKHELVTRAAYHGFAYDCPSSFDTLLYITKCARILYMNNLGANFLFMYVPTSKELFAPKCPVRSGRVGPRLGEILCVLRYVLMGWISQVSGLWVSRFCPERVPYRRSQVPSATSWKVLIKKTVFAESLSAIVDRLFVHIYS